MDTLPPIFADLEGKISFVRQVTNNECHASCPSCGGSIHENGTYPDRFVMWVVSRTGKPFGLCRKCNYHWSPEKSDAHWTAEEREEFKRKVEELERDYYLQKALELQELADKIEKQGFYKDYHQNVFKSEQAKRYYASIGLADDWIKYLQKGFLPQYTVKGHDSQYQDSAYTFPIWSGTKVENVKLRVANPRSSNDRYRNLYKSGCQHLYTPIHEDDKFGNKIIVMEGEKKADTVVAFNQFSDEYQVVGVQSSMPERRILNILKESCAEVFYLAFDPDAYVRAEKSDVVPVLSVAKRLGEKRCRLVIPPGKTKIDDAILLGLQFKNLINMAIKPEKLLT